MPSNSNSIVASNQTIPRQAYATNDIQTIPRQAYANNDVQTYNY